MSHAKLAAVLTAAFAVGLLLGLGPRRLSPDPQPPACMTGGIEALTTNCRRAP